MQRFFSLKAFKQKTKLASQTLYTCMFTGAILFDAIDTSNKICAVRKTTSKLLQNSL